MLPAKPRQATPSNSFRHIGLALALLLTGASAIVCQFSPQQLWSPTGLQNALQLLRGFASPDRTPTFLLRTLRLLGESLAIGTLGLFLALILACPLAIIAARWPRLPNSPGPALSWVRSSLSFVARLLLATLRSIPTLVWAFLFVRMLGLGPGPAVFAIALSFAGIIGKLYTELLEAAEPLPPQRLETAGHRTWSIFWYGLLPQVRTQWFGYGLFRFECAIRSASILGIVGAGGIGSEIALSLRYAQYDKLATALLVTLVAIIWLELLSAWLRRHPTPWGLTLLGTATLLSCFFLPIPWNEWLRGETWNHASAFFQGWLHPTWNLSFITNAFVQMGQTLAMAWFATILASLGALLGSPWIARCLRPNGALRDTLQPRFSWLSLHTLLTVWVRSLFQLTRATPTLVWALLFIVWVGPGIFAGTLAMATHTFGLLGRLYSESYEEAHLHGVQHLQAHGATRWACWCYALLPETQARLLAYTLFRFEVNVRTTAVIGFVGAGGIGDAIHTAITLFHFNDLATLLLVLLITVLLLDALGHQIRSRWLPLFAQDPQNHSFLFSQPQPKKAQKP